MRGNRKRLVKDKPVLHLPQKKLALEQISNQLALQKQINPIKI
jgi:hypothetical protein